MDEATIRQWADATLASWLPGYTDELEDGRQRKVVYNGPSELGEHVYTVHDYDGPQQDRQFVVTVSAREVIDTTIHACPPEGSGLMPCCGKTPVEVSRWDRITLDMSKVTCSA